MKFRIQFTLFTCLSLILFGLKPSMGQPQQGESARVERLVSLCKLWGAVKYFHPYLAYRQNIDWDKAVVETIPKVASARNAADYATAVDSMLQALGDPATHVLQRGHPTAAAARRTIGADPSSRQFSDGLLVIGITNYADLADFAGMRQRAPALREA